MKICRENTAVAQKLQRASEEFSWASKSNVSSFDFVVSCSGAAACAALPTFANQPRDISSVRLEIADEIYNPLCFFRAR
jgi:hypothetical protein